MTPRWFACAALALGVVFALLYQFGVPLRSTYGSRINVDEPLYLLTTISLLEDGDIDLANDYALRRYQAFFDQPELWAQSVPTTDGRLLSPHNVGLSLLLVPDYALGGLDGAKRSLAVVGGATILLTALLAYRVTGRAWPSLLVAALLGATAPMFVYATQIYPEMAAAALVTLSVWLLLAPRPGAASVVGLALSLSGLAWLGSKYIPVAAVIAGLALIRLDPRRRVGLAALLAASGLGYLWFHLATYGGLTPYSLNRLYAGEGIVELVGHHVELTNRLYRFVGLWVDAEFGLVRWAPVLLLALIAVPRVMTRLVGLIRSHSRARRCGCSGRCARPSARGARSLVDASDVRSTVPAFRGTLERTAHAQAGAPDGGADDLLGAAGATRRVVALPVAVLVAAVSPGNGRPVGAAEVPDRLRLARTGPATGWGTARVESREAAFATAAWVLPFVAQVLVAVFLSITMRGWWFPGRMLIVVLPLLAIPLVEALVLLPRRPPAVVRELRAHRALPALAERPVLPALLVLPAIVATGLGVYSVAVTAELVRAAASGAVALAVDPFTLAWPPFSALAPLFPLYTEYSLSTVLSSAAWLAIALLLIGIGARRVDTGRSAHHARDSTAPDSHLRIT